MYKIEEFMGEHLMLSIRLKELREGSKITQNDLAKKLSISRATISNYELNERTPDAENIRKYAEYFNVSADYILGLSNFINIEKELNITTLDNIFKTDEDKNNCDESLKEIYLACKKLCDFNVPNGSLIFLDICKHINFFINELTASYEKLKDPFLFMIETTKMSIDNKEELDKVIEEYRNDIKTMEANKNNFANAIKGLLEKLLDNAKLKGE